ncbi:hypothetical protein QUF72_02615 [Desulfobacterales bacterium HSG2]|nr:hypothetical protein [Desulfobacterales bacterium HSG2]
MEPANILKIKSLGDGWNDKDVVMFHACFQLLEDCIEEEKLLDGDIDWNHDEKTREAEKKLRDLYEWWKQRKKLEEIITNDDQKYNEDTEKLTELVKLRHWLWT